MAAEVPRDVQLVHVSGDTVVEIPCDLIRDEDADHDGLAVWHAVPRIPVPFREGGTLSLRIGMLPARSEVRV